MKYTVSMPYNFKIKFLLDNNLIDEKTGLANIFNTFDTSDFNNVEISKIIETVEAKKKKEKEQKHIFHYYSGIITSHHSKSKFKILEILVDAEKKIIKDKINIEKIDKYTIINTEISDAKPFILTTKEINGLIKWNG